MQQKVIITCAVTGSIHTPTMSPHLPVSPNEIADHAIAAAEAGASVLHLHARDPETGAPSSDVDLFRQFLPRIKQSCDAVLNITTGGSSQMTVEQRLSAPAQLSPEMCSLNMGSMNFGLFPMAERHADWKHDWEPRFLENTRDVVFKNTFKDIETVFSRLGDDCDTRFEFECYDVGHINTVAFYMRQKRIKAPVFLQFVMGVLGGMDASPENLMHMKATADRLLGDQYRFSVLAAGRQQMRLGTMGAVLGGNVRVGLEDSLMIARGRLAESNAQQVTKIRRVIEELGLEIATPDEVRETLHLKGGDRTGF
ncbi:3-keto-5-aminohexanoate cleavage protein [Roseibium sp. SCP14]|uniref:3-keto-5-aminohexanoate cleavage protein n=1 Tax=Roseibium sp. SCP14 TaxID=3141375 RepID=UPI0033389618